ncbi:MAG: PQQ-binding-like beta-propeller repeat protein [Verrucomicrobia bacterium]|nr:PQQ-binding-like beta-propeller repeat protein [Verrucomicrobiota bacterium]
MNASTSRRIALSWLSLFWLACLAQTGLRADEPSPEPGSVIWHLPLEGLASTIALGENGQLYTTVDDRLLALSAEGQLLWEHRSDGWPFGFSPMITDGGLVLVATEISWTSPGSFQVQAVSPDGQVAWELEEFALARIPAAMPGGDILLFSEPFGEPPQAHRFGAAGAQLWQQPISALNWFGSPSVRGDGVFFLPGGHCAGPDGSVIWDLYHGEACSPAAMGRDGTAYFSTVPGATAPTDRLIARATDGSIRWEYPAGSVASSPAIMPDDSVVFGTASGKMVRLDKDGALLWEQEAGALVTSSPAITADGLIWCGTEVGRFFALNGDDGTVRWDWALGASVHTSPAVGPDGRVYIAVAGAGVYAIQGAAGPAESAWPMYRHDAARRARNGVVLQVPGAPTAVTAGEGFERGAVAVSWPSVPGAEHYELWRGITPDEGAMSKLAERISGPTQFVDRTCEFEQPYHYRVRAGNGAGLSPLSDAVEGKQSTRRWVRTFESLPCTPPALGDDGLLRVILQGTGEPFVNRLAAVDADGAIRWEIEAGSVVSGPVLGRDGTAYFVTWEAVVAVDDRGATQWTSPLPAAASPPDFSPNALALTGDGELVVAARPNCLYWYRATGTWIRTTSTQVQSEPVVVVTEDGGVCVSGKPLNLSMFERNGLPRWHLTSQNARSMAGGPDGSIIAAGNGQLISKAPSGTLAWTWRYGQDHVQAFAPVIGPDGTIYVATPGTGLSAVSKDGLPLWTERIPQLSSSPALLEDGTLLVYRGNRLSAYGPDGAPLWEVSLPSTNPFVGSGSPIVAPDGTIYAVGGTNLLCLIGSSPLAAPGWPASRRDARQTGNLASPSPAPAALLNVSASEGTSVNQIRLSWAPNPDIAWVEVWRSPGDNLSAAVQIGVAAPGEFEYHDSGLHPGEICHYWLRARNDAGTNDFTETLRGYASADTRQLWVYEAATNLSAPALGLGDTMLVARADGVLLAIDDQGAVAWSFAELTPPLNGPAVALDGTVFLHNENELAAVRADGSLRWKRPLPGGVAGPMTVGWDGALYVAQQDRLTAFDPDGTQRWQTTLPTSRPLHTVLGADDLLRCKDNSGVTVRHTDGTYVRTLPGGGPMALALDGSLYFGHALRVLRAVDPGGAIRLEFGPIGGGRTPPEDGPILGEEGVVYVSRALSWPGDRTYAISGQGEMLWEYPMLTSGMVADDSGGVILARTNQVTALLSDGTLRWDYRLDGVPPSAPLLTGKSVLGFSAGRRLIALQTALSPAAGGWPMWRADAQRSGRTSASSRMLGCRRTEHGELELYFAGTAAASFRVEQSSDLVEWSIAAEGVAVPGTTRVILPLPDEQPRRFFRVRRE